MALPTASDNPFPSLLITEGTAPASPASGKQRLYVDSTTHKLKRVNSSGTATDIEAASASASGCVACRTTSVTANADPYTIPWNGTDVFDPDGYHDPASNNTRITVPTGKGSRLFLVTAQVENGSGTATTGHLRLFKNGTTNIADGAATIANIAMFSAVIYLVDADYLEIRAIGLNGVSLIVTDFPMQFAVAPVG